MRVEGVGRLEVVQQRADPVAAVLDRADLEAGEAAAQPVADGRRDRVDDGPAGVPDDGLEARAAGERGHLVADALPLVEVALVAAVGGVHADDDVLLLHELPERVELGKRERPGSAEAGHRRRADEDDLRPPLGHPLELLDGLLHDGEGDDRRGEDPVLVVERPGLVHPLVQRVDHDVERVDVVAQALLHEAGQRRPHERPVEAELVHQLEAGARLAERGRRLDGPAHDLAAALAVRVADLEVLLLGAGGGHAVEGRVRDVVADLALDGDLRPPVDLDVADDPRVRLREELGQRIAGLVHVVVGVEDRKVQVAGRHRSFPLRR